MKNLEKIFKWLGAFKDEERKKFKNWINKLSPQRKSRTKKLVDYIWKCIDSDEKPIVDEVSKRLYGKSDYDRKQLNNYLLKTWDVIEEFLVHHYYLNDKSKRLNALHDLARDRKLQDEFEELNKTFLTDNTLHIGSEGYFRKYMLQSKNYFSEDNMYGLVKKSKVEFQELTNTLNQAFVITKLQLMCEALSRKINLNEEMDQSFIAEVKKMINNFGDEVPTINLYFQVYNLLNNNLRIDLEELKELYAAHNQYFTVNEQLLLIIYITNYIASNFNKFNGVRDRKVLYEFYKLRLDKEKFDNDRPFSIYWFINLTQLGVVELDLDWTQQFIENYSKYLPVKAKNIVFQLCQAIIFHKRGEFEVAYDLLKDLKSRDFSIVYRIHTYRIMCLVDFDYFKNNNREHVREACYYFKKWLDNHKANVGKVNYLMYSNFIFFTQKLISIEINKNETIQELKETNYVGAKNWLSRKYNQLKKRSKYIV